MRHLHAWCPNNYHLPAILRQTAGQSLSHLSGQTALNAADSPLHADDRRTFGGTEFNGPRAGHSMLVVVFDSLSDEA